MAVTPKSTIKSTFEKGDRPTEAEFGDFIDSFVPIATDGAVGIMEVISTASSVARPAETLVAIATAVQGGKTGVIEVQATADVTALPTGTVGRQILSAIVTASAQGHLGAGTVGAQIFESETTVAAQSLLNISTASETNFGIVEIATQAEMEATTATDRAVTPARLPDYFLLETEQATTSGTAFDFTGIRASAKRITVMFDAISLSGTDHFLIQIGAGSLEASGYVSNGHQLNNAGGSAGVTSTSGYVIYLAAAAGSVNGHVTLTLQDDADAWICSHMMRDDATNISMGAGTKNLSGTLTQVRLTRTGSNTFDAGSVNILVE